MINVKLSDRKGFSVMVELNDGEHHFTLEAAIELRTKLHEIIKDIGPYKPNNKDIIKEIAKS